MLSVNLDLLRASAHHHPGGAPKDAHAHHRSDHLSALRAARRARRLLLLDRLRRFLNRSARQTQSLADHAPDTGATGPCISPAE
ncbi:MAG: hypothetical protein C0524_17060 [Rhodobacter sp.]|nr:hypothetical protein [Rhodobacter sp.]